MKAHYDRRAVQRSFKPGDLVLALLPVPGSALQNRFTGPYVVERKVTDTTYVIRTHERRRNLRTCHINMLKQYHEREKGNTSVVETINAPVPVAVVTTVKESEDDGVETVSVSTGRIDDCIDRVGTAKFVTKIDLLKGYWQVPLTPRAAEISAFVTPDFFGQYSVMAFGMRNAPATFQRLMRLVLQDVPDCEAYLDDIVIFSPSWEEHMNSLRTVFARLAKALLTVNLAKCEFAKATITYLGKQVGQGQVKPVNAKITAITEFPRPSNRRELRRFLGMIGYYRGFCRNFATLVVPLTDLLRPSRKFVWSLECEHAFNGAKDLLCKAPILAAPDFSRAFLLEVDASGVAAGAVLLQRSEANLELPVCYFSKKVNESQRRYSTVEKEALALLLALRHFDVYLSANPFPVPVYTDHNPLVFLSRMKNLNQRLMRWSLIIQEYNLEIVHKRGSEMVLSDALSRAVGPENPACK
ncbi:Retrovirus-related Pol polyprotein from transposon 17.6 [Labeo rohita]|uniref:ribonuclease H n=1 Tax=Labeo rohita TaxID=84645 RepID=A0ABQ8LCI7_LABRO|nr:Retrovirus-related Pol polyprotein from transposon 17.6 [Labeo rohita]